MDKDCLIIGHNEMEFSKYEETLRKMGIESGGYQDLLLNFIPVDGVPTTVVQAFNKFYKSVAEEGNIYLGETLSATISYLVSYGVKHKLTFDFIDSFVEEKERLINLLKNNKYKTIAITTTLYVAYWPIIEIISLIKKYTKEAKIVIGGPYIYNVVELQDDSTINYLWKYIGADVYINSNQGEKALVETITAIKNNTNLDNIDNIYFLKNGAYIKNKISKEDNKLCDNMIDWTLFKGYIGKFVSIRTCISCAFRCAFCAFPQHAGKYQVLEVEKINKDLEALHELDSVKSIQFIDDTLNIPKERFKEILKMMIEKKYGYRWNSYIRCQSLDEETVVLMKESGCEGVFLGIESGSQKILDNMNKRATINQYKNGIELLKKYDILTFASLIIGFPGETYETYIETVDFIKEIKPDFWRAQLWYCDKLTPIWEEREKYSIEGSQFNWAHSSMNSKNAMNLIKEMFIEVKESIWLPQYNFDLNGVFHLLHRGFTLEKVKDFIRAFNKGIEFNINNNYTRENQEEVVGHIKNILNDNMG